MIKTSIFGKKLMVERLNQEVVSAALPLAFFISAASKSLLKNSVTR